MCIHQVRGPPTSGVGGEPVKGRNLANAREESVPLTVSPSSVEGSGKNDSGKMWRYIAFTCILGLVVCFVTMCIPPAESPLSPDEKSTLELLKQCLHDTAISRDMKQLVIPDHHCNDGNSTVLDLGAFKKLQRLSVGSSSFTKIATVRVTGLSQLQSVSIGKDSIAGKYGRIRFEQCDSLQELIIGDGAFRSSKHIELASLPSLKKLSVGSDCFSESNALDLNSLPALESVFVGADSFNSKEGEFLLMNCGAVKELRVGDNAFQFFTILYITNATALERVEVGSSCFKNVVLFSTRDMPGLKSLSIGESSFSQGKGLFRVQGNSQLTEVLLGENAFSSFTQFKVGDVPRLERLVLKRGCFLNAERAELVDLPSLRTLVIGDNCFWKKAGALRVEACEALRQLTIGDSAFNEFQSVDLANLPSLVTLEVGQDCFKRADRLNLTRLSSLETVSVGLGSFEEKEGVFSLTDCPRVRELAIGARAFAAFLKMEVRGVPALQSITIAYGCFARAEELRLVGLEGLTSLRVDHDSFAKSRGSLAVANCSRLREFSVGDNAFSEFKLQLGALPSLERIVVGQKCFRATLRLPLEGFPRLESLFVDAGSFTSLGSFSVSACPALRTITINAFAMGHYSISIPDAPALESLVIGDNCFTEANAFELSGLPRLRNLTVGKFSFLGKEGSFALRDCPLLESLSVGFHSFHKFRIEALERLGSLRSFHTDFACFALTERLSFEGLDHLESVVMEGDVCEKCKEFAVANCPALAQLRIGDQAFPSCATLAIQNNPRLRTLQIGSSSFPWAREVRLQSMPVLESVEIGANSFVRSDGRFLLRDCEAVKQVKIGAGSFAEYSVCQLENLPAVEAVEVGALDAESGSFKTADLELKNLSGLKSLLVGNESFSECARVTLENLPELTSIRLGKNAFAFKDEDDTELVLQTMPKLATLTTATPKESSSFLYPRHLTLTDMPNLTEVALSSSAFKRRTSLVKDNIGALEEYFEE